MKADVGGTQIELRPNSPPYLLKRMVSDGFDIALIFVLFTLLTMLLLKTPLADAYHAHYERCRVIESETAEAYPGDAAAVSAALRANSEYRDEHLASGLRLYLVKAVACFLAELPVLLVVPLLNRNRCTPGNLMTGIMPCCESRRSRARRSHAVSTFLFVFLIDSLGLYLLTEMLTFLLVPGLRLTEMLLNRKKYKTVCDFLTGTTMIEKLSYDGVN